jgi:hypothetical protein
LGAITGSATVAVNAGIVGYGLGVSGVLLADLKQQITGLISSMAQSRTAMGIVDTLKQTFTTPTVTPILPIAPV